ncbi:MAG TPA: adenylate/guanylate cyclase domain-containing protein, partial [Burkholderiales bacterium]|nr:adenylate/guanylate cyclase domain-containing protein [Burkholderiales bacterium]
MLLRHIRLVTGLVLFAYVTTHLLNHACGLLGLAAMEAGRKLFIAAWRSPVGAAALYTSLATHLALALWSLFQRRQLRMPLWEAAQLMLGLAIPTLLITHAIGTHLAVRLYGVIDSYTRMMLVYWARPDLGIRQVLLLLVAWAHGCIGLHFWLRLKPWYSRVAPVPAALALLVPLL